MEELYNHDEYRGLSKRQIAELKRVEKVLDDSKKLNPKPRSDIKNTIKNRQRMYDTVNRRLSEFMDTYMLIGFDCNNNEIVIMNMPNAKDERALNDLVRDVVNAPITINMQHPHQESDDDYDEDDE